MTTASPIDPARVALRDLVESDIPLVLDYWFRSPPGYVESMGADPRKLPSESEWGRSLLERCRHNLSLPESKATVLVITHDGAPIGMHTLFPVTEGDSAIFHAHVWRPEFRGRGLGMITYPQACEIFMRRFDLKKLLFKTPLQNPGAIRVKEKLGIRSTGEEILDLAIMRENLRARVFELTREECAALNGPRSAQSR